MGQFSTAQQKFRDGEWEAEWDARDGRQEVRDTASNKRFTVEFTDWWKHS
jgi:nitrogen fixation protein FixH